MALSRDAFKALGKQARGMVPNLKTEPQPDPVRTLLDKYSPRNVALIMIQCPHVSMVRGLRQWPAEGRQVRKGSEGIAICAPCAPKLGAVDDDGQPLERTNGRMRFTVRYVFDISQTEPTGEPTHYTLSAEAIMAAAAHDRIAARRPVTPQVAALPGMAPLGIDHGLAACVAAGLGEDT